MKVLSNTYLTRWFFVVFTAGILCFIVSFSIPPFNFIGNVVLASLLGITLLDILFVFSSQTPISVQRKVEERLNLGDENKVILSLKNNTHQLIHFSMIEGFPVEMQERSKSYSGTLKGGKTKDFQYIFAPKKRGKHSFGNTLVTIRSVFFMVNRKVEISNQQTVRVFPSIQQMKKYELLVFQQRKLNAGIKKIRRLGNNSEFEQIKNYTQGDEIKKINWKATSRRNELMVNQYQEEKSQNIYCIIDKSRNMQMDFDGLSILDYAINASLVFSNIALKKDDRAGLITYSDKIGTILPADKQNGQLKKIQDALYNQQTQFGEANFSLLFQTIRRMVKSRSMLLLFTNFDSPFAMRRAIPMLRKLNQKHLLVVILFENSDLQELAFQPSKTIKEIYQSVVAEKMVSVKSKIARELQQNGIQTILTHPKDLSVNTINKYLELKAKGAI